MHVHSNLWKIYILNTLHKTLFCQGVDVGVDLVKRRGGGGGWIMDRLTNKHTIQGVTSV